GCTPGSSTVLSNSQASLACARTTVSGSGTTLTVTWALTFTSAFTGAKRVYLYAQDDTGATAGWTQKGTWTIGKPDLIVARIRPEPFTPKIGDAVRFFATVKNIGSAPVPAGKTINTTFWLPWPNYITYSVDSGQGLAVGMERELPASGTWVATSSVNGTAVTSVFAYADDTWNPNLIDESNESNNGYSQAFAPYRACATPGCPQSFGYYYVGIGDPTYIPTYIQQTAPWSNVSFLNMTWRTTTASDWSLLQQQGVKAIVGIPDLLFRYVGPGNYDLYADYQTRWANFVAANTLGAHLNQVAALYLADEPTLNGLTYDDLRLASLAIKQTFPTLPIALVEGPKGWGLDGLQIPVTVDWVGFDLYRIRDPRTSPAYQDSWTLLKAKRTAKQKLLVILDGFWDPGHQTAGGLSQSDMAVVATNYYSLATNDPDAMGLWPFVWNTFVENGVTLTGTRDLPQNVRDEHRRIGKLITGKP
ncbi:MAG: hypothetical protein HYZ92_01580, partial [Candidatus Omnitrophica bacterium]|nr:hypothetical protein [Candidatus Omnitrophota bacterium]